MEHKALILDRDGVINRDRGTYTWKREDWTWMPGIIDLVRTATEKGYRIAVVTNQAGIARNRYTASDVDRLHHYMKQRFEQAGGRIDAIFYCPHYPAANGTCLCRKPGSLMVERALATLSANPQKSFMLGDKERDLIAGKKTGCKTVMIGEVESDFADYRFLQPDEMIPLL
jgi:histidinol-phosphate phosphatase family protein